MSPSVGAGGPSSAVANGASPSVGAVVLLTAVASDASLSVGLPPLSLPGTPSRATQSRHLEVAGRIH